MAVTVVEQPPIEVVGEPESYGRWVLAAPFRAHLVHLMTGTGLPWRVLAQLAGASPRGVRRLLQGRDGRPARRIDPVLARRLYALTSAEVQTARKAAVDPGRAMTALAELTADGHDLTRIGRRLRISTELLVALEEGRRGVVSRLVEAQLRAAAEALDPFSGPIRDEETTDEETTDEEKGTDADATPGARPEPETDGLPQTVAA